MRYTNRSKVATNRREPNGKIIGSVPNKTPNAVAIFKNGMEGDKLGPASGSVSSQSIARDATVSTYKYYWIDWTPDTNPAHYYVLPNSWSKQSTTYQP